MIARRRPPLRAAPRRLARLLETAAAVLALGLYVVVVTQGAWTSWVPLSARENQAVLALGCVGLLAARASLSPLVWDTLRTHRLPLLLGLVLAAGAGLRMAAAFRAGPPSAAEASLVQEATRIITTGDYRLQRLDVPPLLAYLQAAVAATRYLEAVNTGLYNRITQAEPVDFYAWARATSALLGAAVPALVYLAGRRLHGPGTALLAAVLTAGSVIAIQQGRTIDATAGSLLALSASLAAAGWVVAKPKRAGLAAGCAGLAAGVALGFTIAGLGAVLATLVALVAARGPTDRPETRWAWYLLCLGLGFAAVNPFVLLEYHRFLDATAAGARAYSLAEVGIRSLGRHGLTVLRTGLALEPLVAVAAVGGAVLAVRERGRSGLVLAAYLLPCAAAAALRGDGSGTVLVWFVPVLALLAGRALEVAAIQGGRRWPWLGSGRVAALGAGVILLASLLARAW